MKRFITLLIIPVFSTMLYAQRMPAMAHNALENADSLAHRAVVNHHIIFDDDEDVPFFVKKNILSLDSLFRSYPISELDYDQAAERLGVDIATIKAVVEVETGTKRKGFSRMGVPLINFDKTVFLLNLKKNKISGAGFAQHTRAPKVAPDGNKLSANDYQWALLNAAREIDAVIANESTFWGMFQIGGFNWKKCGAKSLDDFVYKMCYSEQTQLQLFVEFIFNNERMHKALQKKDWNKFALLYNGPSYRRRGYHTKLARAYRRFSQESEKNKLL
ncbi:MAG: N-acetylmuramidase family protein [Muribaculaceae bacterium]|nr:N-acetylmuramidase family protein [Muribaculaceae bacterium]